MGFTKNNPIPAIILTPDITAKLWVFLENFYKEE